jgi:hypothetical protein
MLNLQEKQIHVAVCDHMTIEDTTHTIELVKAQYQACGQPLVYVALVPEEAAVPDQSVRTAMTVALRQIQEYCELTAVIFTGDGIKAGIKRTVFSGVLMMMMKGKWHVARSAEELTQKLQGTARRRAQLEVVARLATERGFRI